MRIISGSHKGRRLRAPKNLPVRPTTDRSKEALFNILQNQYEWSEIKTLDLFSGTGNISYEFASRGVSSVTAVDQNRFCTAFISKSSKELELEIQVIQSDVFKFIKDCSLEFDLIFADPPYDIGEEKYFELIELIFKEGNPSGVKKLSEQLGLCSCKVRLPLIQASDKLSQSIFEAHKTMV